MLRPVDTELIPVYAALEFVILRQSAPRFQEAFGLRPFVEAALARLVRGKADGHHFPRDPGDKDVEYSVQTTVIGAGLAAIARPDCRRQNRLKNTPDFIRQPAGYIGDFHESLQFLSEDP